MTNIEDRSTGWVYWHRQVIDKKYDPETYMIWSYLVLLANHADNYVRQIKIERGQYLTGRHKLSEITGISEWKVERVLKLLETTQQIAQLKTPHYRIITIKNYDQYQKMHNKTHNNRPLTIRSPSADQPLTNTNNELYNDKNDKNDTKGNGKYPSLAEVISFWEGKQLRGDPEEFFNHFQSNGWKVGGRAPMKDWNAAARNWSKRETKNFSGYRSVKKSNYEKALEFADELKAKREELKNG